MRNQYKAQSSKYKALGDSEDDRPFPETIALGDRCYLSLLIDFCVGTEEDPRSFLCASR
jgi:hypothetical protein